MIRVEYRVVEYQSNKSSLTIELGQELIDVHTNTKLFLQVMIIENLYCRAKQSKDQEQFNIEIHSLFPKLIVDFSASSVRKIRVVVFH